MQIYLNDNLLEKVKTFGITLYKAINRQMKKYGGQLKYCKGNMCKFSHLLENIHILHPNGNKGCQRQIECVWTFTLISSIQQLKVQVIFLKNNIPISFFKNLNHSHIVSIANKLNNDQLQNSVIVKVPEGMDDYLLVSSYISYMGHKLVDRNIGKICEKIITIQHTIQQIEEEGLEEVRVEEKEMEMETRLFGNKKVKKDIGLLQNKYYNFDQMNNKAHPNIQIATKVEIEGDKFNIQQKLSNRSFISFVNMCSFNVNDKPSQNKELLNYDHVYCEVSSQDSLDIQRRVNVKGLMCLKTPKRYFTNDDKEQISFVEHEVRTYNSLKQIIRHKNLSDIILLNKKQNNFEPEIYSPKYDKTVKEYCKRKRHSNSKYFKSCLKYTFQIISVLYHLHQNGLIMNDIKEDNIMITKDQIIKVIDYAGMTNINMYPKVSERQRRQFSTKAYYYDQGGEVEWNHEFFDMYGLGKVIEYIFAPKQCLESVPKQTQIMILDAVQIKKECMKKPKDIGTNYSEIMHKFMKMREQLS